MSQRPLAFVIMPFGADFDFVFEDLITPSLPAYETIRADTQLDHRAILEKIVTGIERALLVVADLSTMSPNVMYELGIAHTMGKATIMIARDLSSLPFDISNYPVYEYAREGARRTTFVERLRELGEKHLHRGVPFSSPVTDFMMSTRRQRKLRDLEPMLRPDYGTADFAADMSEHTSHVFNHLVRFRRATEELSPAIAELVGQMGVVNANPSSENRATVQRLAGPCANELRFFAEVIDSQVVPGFHKSWARVGEALLWGSSSQRLATMTRSDLGTVREALKVIDEHLSATVKNVSTIRDAIAGIRGLTRELTASAREVELALDRFLSELAFAREYVDALNERLGGSG